MKHINNVTKIYGLDIIRACAIIFVLIGHSYVYLPNYLNDYIQYIVLDGVTLFFVLSGFLIGKILLLLIKKELSTKAIINFWIRRWLRTLPAYYTVLSFLIIISLLFTNAIAKNNIIQYYTFTQNLWFNWLGFFGESWSLSVEEWFYFLSPLMLFILSKLLPQVNKNIFYLLICFLFIAIAIYYRFNRLSILAEINNTTWDMNIKFQVIARLDSIAVGLLLAYLNMYYNTLFLKYKQILLALFFIAIFALKIFLSNINLYNHLYYAAIYYTLLPIIFALVFPFFYSYNASDIFIKNIVIKISTLSYSLYLVNLTLVQNTVLLFLIQNNILMYSKNNYNILLLLLFWLISFIAAYSLHFFVEKPFLAYRNKKIVKIMLLIVCCLFE